MSSIKKHSLVIGLTFCWVTLLGQNSVGVNTNSPNPNAVLELVSPSSNQGFLVPKLFSSDRTNLSTSLTTEDNGLMVFDPDSSLFFYWSTDRWVRGLGALDVTPAGGDLEGFYPNPIIGLGKVTEEKIADGAISTNKLLNSAVTTDKIADLAVTGEKLENTGVVAGNYGNEHLALQLTVDEKGRLLAMSALPILITSENIENLSVLNEDIANGSITISKINPDGNSDKVLIINPDGTVAWEDRSSFTSSVLNQNNLYIGDNTNTAVGLPTQGDIAVSNIGTAIDLEIEDDAVDGEDLASDIAADGLTQDTDGNLNVNVGSGLTIDSDEIRLAIVPTPNEILIGGTSGSDFVSGVVEGDIIITTNDVNVTSEIQDNAVQGDDLDVTSGDFVVTGDNRVILQNTNGFEVEEVSLLKGNVEIGDEATDIIDLTGNMNLNGGGVTIESDLTFSTGETVNNITDVLDPVGDNSTLPTEKSVRDAITSSSEGLQLQVDLARDSIRILQGELDATQSGSGLGTDGSYNTNSGTNYLDGAGSLDAADDLLDAAIASVQSDVDGNETALQGELDATQTGSGLGTDGSYNTNSGTNYLDGAGSLDAADDLLDAAIASVQSDVDGNETALQGELDATQTGSGLGTDGSYNTNSGTNYLDGAGSLDAADDLLDAAIASVQSDVDGNETALQGELDATQSGSGLGTDGSYNTNSGTNYLDGAGSLDAADDLLDAAIASVQSDVDGNETALQGELDATQSGSGLGTDGSYNTNSGTNYLDGAGSLDAADDLLDAAIASVQSDVDGNETALQGELDATQTGSGLGTDGSYNTNSGTNYLDGAGSLDAADDLLDAAIASVQSDVDGNETALQGELDATQTGSGLGTDGSYNTNSGTNYLDGAGSLDAADDLLDAAIASVQSDVDGNETALQGELDATQTGSGLGTDGSYNTNSGTNYLDGAGSLDAADDLLDAAIASVQSDVDGNETALQGELDATQSGSGLGTDGSYNTNSGTNYLDGAGSLDAADDLLDAAIASVQSDVDGNETALQGELDATQTGSGLGTDGSYNTNSGTNYLDGAGSLDAADDLLDAAIASVQSDVDGNETALQGELDATQTGSGLGTDGSYNTNSGTNYLDGAGSLDAADDLLDAAIASVQSDVDGNETALQGELDATQTGSGLGTDGSYNTNSGTNYLDGAGSLDAADDLLDAAIASVQSDVDGNETALQGELDATQSGSGLGTDGSYNTNSGTNYLDGAGSLDAADDLLDAAIASVQSDVDGNETALQGELDATQSGSGLGTDGSYNTNSGTNYLDGAGSLDAADDLLDAAIASVQSDVDGNETALQGELDATQSGSGLGTDGSYNTNSGTNYLDGAGSLDVADDLLDAAIASVQSDVDGNETALQGELDATQSGSGLGTDGSYNTNSGTNYLDGAGSLDAADDLLDAAIASVQSDVDGNETALQGELDATQTGSGLGTDGSYNTNSGTNYLDGAGSLDAADDLLDAAIASVQSDVDGNETALQGELDATQSGSGLGTDGSYNTNSGTNYLDGAGSLDAADDLLDAAIASVQSDVDGNETALQGELDATQSGSGLGTDGSYNTNSGTNYLDGAGSLDAADDLLDAAIASVQSDVDGNETALQGELDATQTGSGLGTDGSYNTNSGTNYLDGAGSLDAADDLLDAAIASVQSDVDGNETALQGELDATQTGSGLGTDGSYDTNSGTNYIDGAGSLDAADDLLDAAIASVQSDVDGNETALQGELDATQTGSGLGTDGSYNTNSGTNYLDGAGSLDAADDLLDAAIASVQSDVDGNETALQGELDATQTGSGLGTDGSYNTNSGTNYLDGAGSLDAADDLLDAAIASVQSDVDGNETALQGELDATQTGSGLGTDGSYNTNSGTNYIDGAGSLDAADDLLDAAIASVQSDVDGNETALQGELDATQSGSGLGTDGSYNTNSGTNYIDGAGSLDAADDLLDAAIASVQSDVDGNETALQGELDATQSGSGLGTDGSYNTNSGTNYIDGAGSLDVADDLLDAAIASVQSDVDGNETALQGELDATQTGSGLGTDGSYNTNSGTNYLDGAGSLDAADDLLDAAIASVQSDVDGNETVLQGELDATQTGSGLGTDGSYNTNSGTNYLDGAGSLDAADDLLDAAIKANADAIASDGDTDDSNEIQTITPGTGINATPSGDDYTIEVNGTFGNLNLSTTGTLGAGATTVSSLKVTSLNTDGAVFTIGGDGTFSVSSDKRLKENISLLQNTLDKLDRLGGYNYNYKVDKEKKKQIGVIAQELQKVFPELVSEDDRGYLAVNYQGLIPVLMQAIKEQRLEINQLNDRLKAQESKLSELSSENDEMKKDLEYIKRMIGGGKAADR